MARLDHSFLLAALRDQLTSTGGEMPLRDFAGASVNTRTLMPGQLFFALPGEKRDGHEFIPEAMARGAGGIVCLTGRGPRPRPPVALYEVPDVLAALRTLAGAWRGTLTCPVVAVVGSVGKTTSKELIAALLRGRYDGVAATRGSENGFIGIPLTLLRMPAETGAAVVEIGIDAPGAMVQHLELVRPTAGIVTAIEPEHLETMGDLATVAREESLCLWWLAQQRGACALCLDDPELAPQEAGLRAKGGRILTYGLVGPDGRRVAGTEPVLTGAVSGESLATAGVGLDGLRLTLPLPGDHNARNLLGAVAVAHLVGLSPAEMQEGLATFKGPDGRSEVRKGPKGVTVLCDYYNASPASMAAALQTAAAIARKSKGRVIACLADMLELGTLEEAYHRGLADPIVAQGTAKVLCTGPRMSWLVAELKARGFPSLATHFETPQQLAEAVLADFTPSDVLLIKGSRGMAMERVWQVLAAAPAARD